ncbi:MAG: XRE family transcriptional regulator [Pirellula sp.]|nr:XRE family transcriptional regulator [Pirellula sp.]
MATLHDQKFLQELGLRLRAAREKLDLTQAELAEQTGLDRTFVGFCERGTRNISLLNLRKLAKQLRVRLSDLFADLN